MEPLPLNPNRPARRVLGTGAPPQERKAILLPEPQKQSYEKFYESTAANRILDEKTTAMVQLAVSFAIGCYP